MKKMLRGLVLAAVTLSSFAAYQGLTMNKVYAQDAYNVTFTGTLANTTINVRTGPGTNYSTAFTYSGGQQITFSGLEYGSIINDYWTGNPDPRWYYFYNNGTKYWIASALVNGNPPSSSIRAKDRAIAWAINQYGSTAYNGYCEAFVETAYGTGYIYPSAIADSNANNTYGSLSTAPIGSLIFFKADSSNQNYGHVGIYIGQNTMISGLSTVQTTNIPNSSYWTGLYSGWGNPPSGWNGHS